MSHKQNQTWILGGKTGSGKTYHSQSLLENDLKHIPRENKFLMSPTATEEMDDTLLPYFDEENISQQIKKIQSSKKNFKLKNDFSLLRGEKGFKKALKKLAASRPKNL